MPKASTKRRSQTIHPYESPIKAPEAENYIINPDEVPTPSPKKSRKKCGTTPGTSGSTNHDGDMPNAPAPSSSSVPLGRQGAFYVTRSRSTRHSSAAPLTRQGAFYDASTAEAPSPSRRAAPLTRQGAFYDHDTAERLPSGIGSARPAPLTRQGAFYDFDTAELERPAQYTSMFSSHTNRPRPVPLTRQGAFYDFDTAEVNVETPSTSRRTRVPLARQGAFYNTRSAASRRASAPLVRQGAFYGTPPPFDLMPVASPDSGDLDA
ncbi:hypothetical protein CVT24_001602 [Panaeolus cyanescens]|uniref:Uncharacterized protein n=1 Tax=Panaeolus cyanescens TaxID=181874 RepID=A0A409YFF7_9AGAR|nr:hypothetical protein CVT24_001602 [Panaeolus cyanescens]